jgi:hypothetical protein
MPVQPPISSVVPKIIEDETRRSVGPIPIIERYEDTTIAEPDDIYVPLPTEVSDIADVFVDAPPGLRTKAFYDEGGGRERLSIVSRNEDPGGGKSDDIAKPITCSITDRTNMVLISPAGVVAEF